MHKRTPKEDLDRLSELLRQSKRNVDIAAELGWPVHRVRNLVKRTGVYRRRHDKIGKIREQVGNLVRAGLTDRAIAKRVNRTRWNVSGIRRELGLPCNRDSLGRGSREFVGIHGCTAGSYAAELRSKEREKAGWPRDTTDAEWRVMDCLERNGPLTPREMQRFLSRSYTAVSYAIHKCLAFGWMVVIGKRNKGRLYDLAGHVKERRRQYRGVAF